MCSFALYTSLLLLLLSSSFWLCCAAFFLPFFPCRKFFPLPPTPPPPPPSPPRQQEKLKRFYILTSSVLYRHIAEMADGLKMGNLSLNESQHAPPPTQPSGRGAYIPPHLRQRNMNMDGATPPPGPGSWAPRYASSSPRDKLVSWI